VTSAAETFGRHRRLPVLADMLPGARVRDTLLVLGSTLFMAALAQVAIPLPFTPVPLTLGTFGALLIGATLGPLRAGISLGLYLVLGMLGVGWFANGNSGWAIPTLGYVIGYLVAAIVVGRLARRGADRSPWSTFGIMMLGSLIIYAIGVPYLAIALDYSVGTALAKGAVPFLIGDAIKAAAAALLLPGAWRLIGKGNDNNDDAAS